MYWTYAFAAGVYLINRLTTPILQNTSPYQKLFNVEPNYMKLLTFGCLCYPWIKPYGNNKFSPKPTPCVFMGYSLTQSTFLCLDVVSSWVFVSRHVEFKESIFPFQSLSKNSSSFVSYVSLASDTSSASFVLVFHRPAVTTQSMCIPTSHATVIVTVPTQLSINMSLQQNSRRTKHYLYLNRHTAEHQHVSAIEQSENTTLSLPQPPPPPNMHGMTTRSKSNIHKPKPTMA